MSALSVFSQSTLVAARMAVPLYFAPLSELLELLAADDEIAQKATRHAAGTDRFWIAAERIRARLRTAHGLEESRLHAAHVETGIARSDASEEREYLQAEFRRMAKKWADLNDQMDRYGVGVFFDQARLSSSMKVSAWLVAMFASAVLSVLAMASFNIHYALAAIIGLATSVTQAFAISAIVEMAIYARQETSLKKKMRSLQRKLRWWAAACLSLLAGLAVVRVFNFDTTVLPILLASLSLVLPIGSGLLLAWSRLLGWSEPLVRKIEEVNAVWMELKSLEVEVSDLLAERRSSSHVAAPIADRSRSGLQ